MRPEAVAVEWRRLPLTRPYAIAGEYIDTADVVLLRLRMEDGLEAYGAAAPAERITGETAGTVMQSLTGIAKPFLEDADLRNAADVLDALPTEFASRPAARAAVDIALHDLRAKQLDAPLRQLLGSRPDEIITSVTIGICDVQATVKQGRAHVAGGFASLKVKVGEALDVDVARLKALRRAIGNAAGIRVDANQGYDADQACRFLDAIADVRIDLFEQPTPADDLDALKHVTTYAGRLPVMADESAVSLEGAMRVLERGAASALNIKLMKCGGLGPAREILAAARRLAVPCMIGCFDESRISMAAAAHLALSDSQVWWADLDGHLDLAADVVSGGINVASGYVSVPDAPGLGVEPEDWPWVAA